MPKETRETKRNDNDSEEEGSRVVRQPPAHMLQLTAELVPAFSGTDNTYPVQRWIDDVETNAEIFGWSSLQQLLVARRSLTGTAALWLKAERPYRSWEDLKAALIREFPDTVDVKAIHELMSARKKMADESCIDYMLVMKELGKRGKMADYVAIKYIVDGIRDIEMNKVMLYGVTTYNDLKEKLKIYEAITKKMRESEHKMVSNKQRRVRCYACGALGHASSECPNKSKGTKCFKCNQFGHIGSNCTGMKKNEVEPSSSQVHQNNNRRSYQSIKTGHLKKRAMFGSSANDIEYKMAGNDCAQDGRDVCDSDSESVKSEVMQVVRKPKHPRSTTTKKPIIQVNLGGLQVKVLVDSGSDVNIISSDIYNAMGRPKYLRDDIALSGIGLTTVHSIGKCLITLCFDGITYDNVIFHIISKEYIPYDAILGQEFLSNVTVVMEGCSVRFVNNEWLSLGCSVSDVVCFGPIIGPMESHVLEREVRQCVECYQPNQVKEAPLKLKIILKDDIPIRHRPRRLSLAEQEIVERQVLEWMNNGIIQVSYSEYSSPLVLVKKKDGTTRVCVDYRMLNRKMVKDDFPLPVIEDLIDKLKDSTVFSVLDLKNGFFHLRVSEESIHYTSFVTHNGQYEFLRAPFGLSICPKYFMRFISIIFRELLLKGEVMIFIDDLLIPATDEEEAVHRLKKVLLIAEQYGLEINWKKAKLICQEIEYLGHLVRNGEVQPTPEKTDAVLRYPMPTTVRQVHSFIGLTSYFRKYIPYYASIAKPLTDLLRKDNIFSFGEEQIHAFNSLKQRLGESPVLKIYNSRLPSELHTDASSIAYSAILLQLHSDGLHPVYYMSKRTSEGEAKYSSYELEALAVIEGVKKFRNYLFGIHFKIVTDCQAFEATLKKKDLSAKVARWVLFLDQFDYEVEHRSGTKMRHIDALSRNPCMTIVTGGLREQIKHAQQNDEGLKAICEILKSNTYQDYWLDNELLYKGDQKLLVIPQSMDKAILKQIHSNGHFSVKKMKELIIKDYYIKDLEKKLQDFVVTCIPCLLATRKAGKQEGYLNPLVKEDTPLHTIHIDHIGPLTDTKKQYNHILTLVDGFTKFTWIFPTKSTTSKEALDKIRIHQQHFGNPHRFITDRGTAFTSTEFRQYCEEENIQHVTITTGVPRGNGQVERVHRTIIAVLTKLCIENPALWYRHVSRLQRSLNSTYHRSIDTSPFKLLVGTNMRNKEDLEIIQLLQQEEVLQYDKEREEHRLRAKQQIYKVQEENRKTFDRNRKPSTKYNLGDLVAIKRTQFGTGLKLKPKYLGPYRVTKVKRNDRYDVEREGIGTEGPHSTSSSADQMKRWPITDVD